MNTRKIFRTASFLAVALVASAAGDVYALDSTANVNGSELVFSIWDPTVGQEASYTLGLNINVPAFNAWAEHPSASYNYNYNFGNILASTGFATYLGANSAGGANNLAALRWNIMAANTSVNDGETLAITHGPAGDALSLQNLQVQDVAYKAKSFFSNFSGNDGGTENATSLVYAGGTVWVPQGTAGNIGDSLGFYLFTNNNLATGYTTSLADPADVHVYQNSDGLGTFTLTAYGDLIYHTPAVVPVPAAIWLLGSGMLGLMGGMRRRAHNAVRSS